MRHVGWISAWLVAASLLVGCASDEAKRAPQPVAATSDFGTLIGGNLEDLADAVASPLYPDSVHWSRNSAEHRAAYLQAYRLAGEVLARRVAGLPAGTKWAVALDADETIIDNSLYQKARGFLGYSKETWNEWVRLSAAATRDVDLPAALPGAVQFLQRVRAAGGAIAIVTDREAVVEAETRTNLTKLDVPFDVLLCKPPAGDQSKGARWKKIEDGSATPDGQSLKIVMWVGDNIRDFPNGDQTGMPGAFFEEFGDQYFVLPNPMYGSWPGNPRK
ncbi:MAG: hypothetical protein K8T90_15675 [Planctomycetes bacterium]|nr:hypothetical protein [Planctomycetota bacterium]